MKTLYFEGAGWSDADSSKATVGNCRIRTAFSLDDGRRVYLECSCYAVGKKGEPVYRGSVDHCHYITDEVVRYASGAEMNDDCNRHRIYNKWEHDFDYDHAGILKLVNNLGASFDEIVVLPDLAGFRVFPEKKSLQGTKGYNYGDEFEYDGELTERRHKIRDAIYEWEKAEREEDRRTNGKRFVHGPGSKVFPNFSLWVDEGNKNMLHLLRHYNGHNKHWVIDASRDDWRESMIETGPGRNDWCAWE